MVMVKEVLAEAGLQDSEQRQWQDLLEALLSFDIGKLQKKFHGNTVL